MLRSLRWRCRRGMQELDILLTRHLARIAGRWPECEARREADLFGEFLELPDPQLAGYLLRDEVPPAGEFTTLVAHILASTPVHGQADSGRS